MTHQKINSSTNSITESVLALNQIVLGSAASTSMATMYVSMAHAAGVGTQNSVSAQQNINIIGAAALAAGTGNLLWDGLSQQVSDITVGDRLSYWQKMMQISTEPISQAPIEQEKNESSKDGETDD